MTENRVEDILHEIETRPSTEYEGKPLRPIEILAEEVRRLQNELARLEEKLPVTKDGVTVVPGMHIYPKHRRTDLGRAHYCVARMVGVDPDGFTLGEDIPCDEPQFSLNYSSVEAAEAAARKDSQ